MKSIVIISTYPESGSKNIGDQLIAESLAKAIGLFEEANIEVIWRAEPWESAEKKVLNADHIFFACLAIRSHMHEQEYPYLRNILDSGIPFSIISAGTDLPVSGQKGLFSEVSEETLGLLKRINDQAKVFTTRGYLTQEFCRKHGLDKARFSGDVAFFNPEENSQSFEEYRDIKKIIISDPHRAKSYLQSFSHLVFGVQELFPSAELVVAVHGENPIIERFCKDNTISCLCVYKDRYSGLRIYDDADLHVGFRVHAHVSALKRGIYSYLLEQDGRGCDYGLTIDRKISIPNYSWIPRSADFWGYFRVLISVIIKRFALVSSVPASQMIALLRSDAERGFVKFSGLEMQIGHFNLAIRQSVKEALEDI